MTRMIAHLVDDDDAIRDAMAWLLRSRGVTAQAWASAEEFLAAYRDDMRGCLVLDIRMTGMSGPELFDRLLELGCRMPTIFLTGHGNVPQAVNSIKKGAFDFIEKPFNDNDLADRVLDAFRIDAERSTEAASAATIEARLDLLTTREREVMERILAGKFNKVIADELNIAMRTVEVHRSRVFEKMGVRSAVELAGLLAGNAARNGQSS